MDIKQFFEKSQEFVTIWMFKNLCNYTKAFVEKYKTPKNLLFISIMQKKMKSANIYARHRSQHLVPFVFITKEMEADNMNRYVKYILKRILSMLVIFVIVSVFIFFVLRVAGVSPISVLGGEKGMTDEVREQLEIQYNLDKPLITQYVNWVTGIFSGDLGIDYINRQNVWSLITPRIPITIGLVVVSMLIAIIIAIPAGVLSAVYKNTPVDSGISILSLILVAMPGFLVSILMIVFCAKFVPGYSFVGTYNNFSEYLSRIILPSIALSFSPIAFMTRVSRSSMIEQLKSPYIATAKAKGLSPAKIVFKHAFHNAVLPVLTIGSMMVGTTIAGAVLVENVFSLPGIGSLLITAIKQYNYPVSQTLILLLLAIFLIISCLVDIIYALVDPRISIE